MPFMVMHKTDASMEAAIPPSQAIIQGMGQLVGEGLKSGLFLDGAGLHRSAQRVRLRFAGGKCTVTRGPLVGDNEMIAGFAMIKATSMDEAIEHAHRFAAVVGDVELEIGPVVEPWDLGFAPKPAGLVGGRFLILHKGDARFEAGTPFAPPVVAAMGKLIEEMTAQGVLISARGLAPSAQGARLASGPKGKRTWVDGPFAESKELIAGFSILGVKTQAEAIVWATRYAEILDGNEVDVRLVTE